jgi:hypothetical protein
VDFHALNDHPSNVLRGLATELLNEISNEVGLDRAILEQKANGYAGSARVLTTFELAEDVTFVALDRETLEDLVETFKGNEDDSELDRYYALEELVGKLFGLEQS